ncbi:MAG: S8 family serine peptidase [Phycisphaeraceae bacterium]
MSAWPFTTTQNAKRASWVALVLLVGALGLLRWLAPFPSSILAEDEADPEASTAGRGEDVPFEVAVGLADARKRFGEALPTGRGVVMGQVEGGDKGYLPNRDDNRFRGVTLRARSGASDASGHATHTAGLIYGRRGLAPGVETVHHFSVRHWLSDGYLRMGQPAPPRDEPVRVWSHSWISNGQPGASDKRAPAHALRRVDYAIDTQGAVMCVGVNNGRTSAVPALLAGAYNTIAVGAANGASSGRYTQIETHGRCKPELIAPKSRTSYSTPVVAAFAARLVEMAQGMGEDAPNAARPEVIKAALLAGAVKPWNWNPEPGKPLDEHLGAGRVHLGHALRIMDAGMQPPGGETVSARGWDYRAIEREQSRAYHVEVGEDAAGISVIVTWHRRINGGVAEQLLTGQRYWIDAPRLADVDLRVHYTSEDGQSGVIGRSVSDIDNVEHVYIDQPPAGAYRIEVARKRDAHDEAWTYAVAWRVVEAAEE